ncbi:MAG: type II toxin-antitoxin system RelE/ParE family toxin [Pseudomonadota bacterium]
MWKIHYEAQASKFLKKSDKELQKKILKFLVKISEAPKSFGKPLTANLHGLWRYRVGDYRIICDLREKDIIILVIDIGHRSEIYKS